MDQMLAAAAFVMIERNVIPGSDSNAKSRGLA